MITKADTAFMHLAIELAGRAEAVGEVPVGAVLTFEDKVIATTYNCVISSNDPTAHAEIEAIRVAGRVLKNYRLNDAVLYVTLEPCPMCAGAIIHSRISRVVFGAFDKNSGAAGSVFDILGSSKLNHNPIVIGGVERTTCAKLLTDFFKKRRPQSDGKFTP